MKPKPLAALKNLTVPFCIYLSPLLFGFPKWEAPLLHHPSARARAGQTLTPVARYREARSCALGTKVTAKAQPGPQGFIATAASLAPCYHFARVSRSFGT